MHVGLDFRYEVSLHQILLWMAEQCTVWSTPPSFPLKWHYIIPGIEKAIVVLTILTLSNCTRPEYFLMKLALLL